MFAIMKMPPAASAARTVPDDPREMGTSSRISSTRKAAKARNPRMPYSAMTLVWPPTTIEARGRSSDLLVGGAVDHHGRVRSEGRRPAPDQRGLLNQLERSRVQLVAVPARQLDHVALPRQAREVHEARSDRNGGHGQRRRRRLGPRVAGPR